MSRRQAFSAGLVAGAFFSSGCSDNEAPNGGTSDADIEDPERADEVFAAEVWTPVVTALPEEAPDPKTEVRMARPRSPKVESALRVPAHMVIETVVDSKASTARVSNADEPQLERQSMLGDSYAAFGADALR